MLIVSVLAAGASIIIQVADASSDLRAAPPVAERVSDADQELAWYHPWWILRKCFGCGWMSPRGPLA
jgi:hypothetical protein